MAVQLIRNLSALNMSPDEAEFSIPAPEAPRGQPEQPGREKGKPLLLQEEAHSGDARATAPEFRTIRLDAAQPAGIDGYPQWLADIERLEASARQAMDTLTNGHDGSETRREAANASNSESLPEPTAAQQQPMTDLRADVPQPRPEGPQSQDAAQHSTATDPAGPEAEADGFSPRSVANADIRPEDGDPGAKNDRAIRENMDINRRAIEEATADSSHAYGPQSTVSHDYLAMEDKAIDRLLETTNALLENDDHTRKNQSLDRLKAAVVATEAERRISVKTATGTVTLDFEEKGSTRRPVADLLAAPKIDPEKRRQRLQDYRKMIAEHKKRP